MRMGELEAALSHYRALCASVPLKPIRTKKDYLRAVAVLDELLDAGGAQQSHPLAELAAALGEFIADYEQAHDGLPASPPKDLLAFLLQQHGLRQSDLPEVGSQGIVSELLAGKRQVNARQARALGKRFGVPPGVFV